MQMHVCCTAIAKSPLLKKSRDEFEGQLGNNDTARPVDAKVEQPVVKVVGGHKFTQVAAGHQHCCAIDEDGDAWCWG